MGQAAIIDLHRTINSNDIRPYVWVRFLKHGNKAIRHSVLLDTGSPYSHIPCGGDDKIVSASDARGAVYIHEPSAPTSGGPCTLWFGHVTCTSSVEIKAIVAQTVELVGVRDRSSFNHDVHLGECPVERGLLGCAATSSFARDAGIFALIPPDVRDWPETPAENSGMLLVGEHDEGVLALNCAPGMALHWNPVEKGAPMGGWYVRGSISVGVGEAGLSASVVWMVDTGANGIFVPESIYEFVMAAIERVGSTVGTFSFRSKTRITNCRDYAVRFPTLTITLTGGDNRGQGFFVVEIPPSEYIERVSHDESTCVCILDPSLMSGRPNVCVVGMGIMRKTVTVFDARNNRVGFCHLRRAPAPQPLLPPFFPSSSLTLEESPCPGDVAAATWIYGGIDLSSQRLALTGGTSVNLGENRWIHDDVTWIQDPNAIGIYVPHYLHSVITRLFDQTGSGSDGCSARILSVLPELKFRFSSEPPNPPGSLITRISSAQYMQDDAFGKCRCTLIPVPSSLDQPALVPLGPDALRGRVVMLDPIRRRSGFCPQEMTDTPGVFSLIPRPVIEPSESVPIELTSGVAPGGAPTVSVVFENQYLNVIHSMRFNTAISLPRMPFGGTALTGRLRPAQLPPRTPAHPEEGYVDTGAVRIRASDLPRDAMQRIEETMIFPHSRRGLHAGSGTKELRVRVHMDVIEPTVTGPGSLKELAAGPSSQFAIATKIFALIPNGSSRKGFKIVVGERDEAQLNKECRPGDSLKWLLLDQGDSWAVAGTFSAGSTSLNTTLLIASSYDRVLLPISVYSKVVEEIALLSGGKYIAGTESIYGMIPNCDDSLIAKLPSIRVDIRGAFEVRLDGPDYVFKLTADDEECYSRLLWVNKPDDPEVYPLGSPFLNKVVTVFDTELGRIGFCPAGKPL